MDDAPRGRTLTIDRETTVAELLDIVCEELECSWELVEGDPPTLRVGAATD